jgi:hypothetical protein
MSRINFNGKDNERLPLISAPQALTAVWADLGLEINCMDRHELSLWLALDINDSTGVQFRILGRGLDSTTWYSIPIETVASAKVTVAEHVEEFATNADQNLIIPVVVDDTVPIIKIQVLATVVGAAPGNIASAFVAARSTRAT